MKSFEKVCGCLSTICGTMAGWSVIVAMLVMVIDVIGRYVFNNPLLGSVELNRILLVAIVFLGVSYAQLSKAHVRVDLVLSRTSSRLRLILEACALLIALVLFALMLYAAIPVAYNSIIIREYETGVIPFPMWPARVILTIGLFIFVLQLVADTKATFRELSVLGK